MREEKEPYTANAADKGKVKEGSKKANQRRRKELADIKVILELPQGRRVLWRLMEQCNTFESIMEQSSRIYYLAGRQDLGHFLMAEIVASDEEALFKMMREAKDAD